VWLNKSSYHKVRQPEALCCKRKEFVLTAEYTEVDLPMEGGDWIDVAATGPVSSNIYYLYR